MMPHNEKAHLRGAGFVNKSTPGGRGDQPSVSPLVNNFATNSADAVIDAVSIAEVWRALGGGELRRGRGRAFWRDGDGFNVGIDSQRGTWRDFATNEGGGKLKLIQTVLNCSKQDAFKWLADLAGIRLSPERAHSREERRRYAETRRDAAQVAKLAVWFLESRREELEKQKRQCNGVDGPWDDAAIEFVSAELWRLDQLDAAGVIAEWMTARQSDPQHTRQLEQVGQAWQAQFDRAISSLGRCDQ